jgi:hypothetical protein
MGARPLAAGKALIDVDLEEPPESCGAVARRCDVAQKGCRGETLTTHYYPPRVNKEYGSTPKSDRDDPDDLEEPPEWCGAVAHECEGRPANQIGTIPTTPR